MNWDNHSFASSTFPLFRKCHPWLLLGGVVCLFLLNPAKAQVPLNAVLVEGTIFYAIENLDAGTVDRRGTTGSGGVLFDGLILSPNTRYRVWLLDAATFQTAHVEITTPNAGLRADLPEFFFGPASSHDTDGDELHDLGEFILGTVGLNPDSDGDGIKDGAEVRQGTNPLDGFIASTGIVGTADTPGQAQDVAAFNDVVVVADTNSGVIVFNVFNGMDPLIIAQVNTPGSAQAVSLAGNQLAVADGDQGFAIIDVSDPPAAAILHQIPLGSPALSTATNGQFAFVGLQNGAVVALEMGSGLEVDRLNISSTSQVDDISIYGGRLYAVTQRTLHVLEFEFGLLSELATTSFAGDRNTNAPQRLRLFVGGDIAYPTHTRGYATIDVSDPANPSVIGNIITSQFGWKHLVGNGNGLGFVAASPNSTFDGPHHVHLYNISDPNNTNDLVTSFETPGVARAVTIYNGIGYVADHTAGLHVVNYLAFDRFGEPPEVSIIQPADGSDVEEGSSFLVRVDVMDDIQVRNVEFYVDDVLLKTDGNYPFEVTLPAGNLKATNTIEVIARASDTGGNATFSEPVTLNLTPDSTPPRVVAVLPVDNGFIGETNGYTVFFSEPVKLDTINDQNLILKGAGPDELLGTPDDVPLPGGVFSQSEDGSIVSYTLPAVLDSGYFQISVETGVTDNIGNPLLKRFTSVFRALGDTDSDRDGLPDAVELTFGLDPLDPDSDDDGIFDGNEDIDQDGVVNSIESLLGFSLDDADSDNDGIPDNEEDRDMDGLPDFREVLVGSNLELVDSDGDGFSDEAEVTEGSSPVDPNDVPDLFVYSRPPAFVTLLSSDFGDQPPSVTMARPPAFVTVLSSDFGDQPPSLTLANPPAFVTVLSSDLGNNEPGVTLARPPAFVTVLSSDFGNNEPGVTLAKPPVTVTDPVE